MYLIASLFLVVMVDTDDTRRTVDDRRLTTPGVWHKLPTGELKMPKQNNPIYIQYKVLYKRHEMGNNPIVNSVFSSDVK